MRETRILCPNCEGWLVVDLESGEVLDHGAKGEGGRRARSLDEVVDRVHEKEQKGDEKFESAVRSVEEQKKRLEQAFEEARRKAGEKPDDRPLNPLDDLFR